MSAINSIDLERLRGDLQLRPLSAQAIRLAHQLVRCGREFFDPACYELVRCDLAEWVHAEDTPGGGDPDDPADTWVAPTDLLEDLAEAGMMDVLETTRLVGAARKGAK